MSERLGSGRARNRQGHGLGNGEKAAFWQGHLEAWRRAGGSVRGYCRLHGLSEPSFYFWRRQLDQRAAVGAKSTPRLSVGAVAGSKPQAFVSVAVVEDRQPSVAASRFESEAAGIEIVLPGGAVMRVTPGVDRTLLADALLVLAKLPGSEVVGC